MAEPDKPEFAYEYNGFGSAAKLFQCWEPEVLIEGPAGTGKSRAVCQRIHCSLCFPGQGRFWNAVHCILYWVGYRSTL